MGVVFMKFAEFKDKVQEEYRKILPNSMCQVYIYKCLGKSLDIVCRMAGNEKEFPHGIAGNDMLNVSFSINLPDNFNEDRDELPDALVMEVGGKFYRIKPENSLSYCSSKSLPYRKTKGNADKFVKTIKRYFAILRSNLEDDLKSGNIHKDNIKLLEEKLS